MFCFASLFSGFIWVTSSTPSEPFSFPPFFSPSLTSFQIARTKTTLNPPPQIDYKALYPWASEDLLAETSKLTSGEDVTKHWEDEAAYMTHVFGRECDTYFFVRSRRMSLCVSTTVSTTGNPSSSSTPPSSGGFNSVCHSRGPSGGS